MEYRVSDYAFLPNSSTHKTEVSGSNPEWLTKSALLEGFDIRELPTCVSSISSF